MNHKVPGMRSVAPLLCALLLPAAALAEPIFRDGFETGNLCAWSTQLGGPPFYTESFSLPDGSPWPAPWTAVGSVALADVQGGQARFRPTPSGYSLARLVAPIPNVDVEVRLTVIFEDVATQGLGFYVRQNGGYLQQTTPPGAGLAVFVEGFRATPGIGVWREENGVETPIEIDFDPALNFQNGVPYRVRFRVTRSHPSLGVVLHAKIWPLAQAEPPDWQVSTTFPWGPPTLSGIALDSWSSIQAPSPITAHTLVDDLEVEALCDPLADMDPVLADFGSAFQFTEGPVWRGDHFLFSDIGADTIYRLDLEPSPQVSIFRTPSDRANGLARLPGGELLAAEHHSRRVSLTQAGGSVVTLVDDYQGMAFNSPNDLAVRSDGTVYFTDPDYGLAVPGDRELPFNGLFRRDPAGILVAEWFGVPGANEPNGVALSPNEQRLFVTDTQAGELIAYDVAADGSLSNRQVLVSGLNIPDGLCIDRGGNVYVGTGAPDVQVYTSDGTLWGVIPTPSPATNCAFGGEDHRLLLITARQSLRGAGLRLPGIP